ncbi:MAG TPA: hypothetical protein VK172_14455, partial [Lentimicrobium sp.]|nr:hypothetical protein [Lentimicrobium sp.]
MTINIRKGLLRGLYLVVALILLVMSFQTYMVLESIKIINAKVKDHIAHRDLLIQAYEAFKDVENSSRGFVMLKDPLYLSYRNKGLIKLGTSLRQLKVEYSIDSMKPRYQEIDSLFTNRLMELDMMLISSDSSLRKPVLSSSAITLEKARILIEENLQREYTVINKYNAMI